MRLPGITRVHSEISQSEREGEDKRLGEMKCLCGMERREISWGCLYFPSPSSSFFLYTYLLSLSRAAAAELLLFLRVYTFCRDIFLQLRVMAGAISVMNMAPVKFTAQFGLPLFVCSYFVFFFFFCFQLVFLFALRRYTYSITFPTYHVRRWRIKSPWAGVVASANECAISNWKSLLLKKVSLKQR